MSTKRQSAVTTLMVAAVVMGAAVAYLPKAAADDPDDPTPTSSQEESGPGIPRPKQGAQQGLFSGTYVVAPYGSVIHVSSDCPGCDAVAVSKATVTMTWNGVGYTRSWVDTTCGPQSTLLTPVAVAGGYIQSLAIAGGGACIGPVTGTWTRTGP